MYMSKYLCISGVLFGAVALAAPAQVEGMNVRVAREGDKIAMFSTDADVDKRGGDKIPMFSTDADVEKRCEHMLPIGSTDADVQKRASCLYTVAKSSTAADVDAKE